MEFSQEQIAQISDSLSVKLAFLQKTSLNLEEAAKYMGVAKRTVQGLTSKKLIPHYKPNGKMIYISREDLDNYMHTNRVATQQELEKAATT